jgi:hypothetical protein
MGERRWTMGHGVQWVIAWKEIAPLVALAALLALWAVAVRRR